MAPNNSLVIWGNDKTMNLNTLILTNIQSSPYFKVQLFELKTFHEVVDEIYYKVDHLEPWEKGSRKTAGQTGMCGGVRGVGAGGIVSSAYCLLYKLFTLRLTKKQVNNLINHKDSTYIRGLGFMYIRYTQSPSDLWDWYEPYLNDEEPQLCQDFLNLPSILHSLRRTPRLEVIIEAYGPRKGAVCLPEFDVKAGGGHVMMIGEMLRQWLVKLEWYSTLFPRIPVPIQKDLDIKLRSRPSGSGYHGYGNQPSEQEPEHIPDDEVSYGEAEKVALSQRGRGDRGGFSRGVYHQGSTSHYSPPKRHSPRRSPPRRSPAHRSDDFTRELEREKERQRRQKEKEHKRSKHEKHRSRSRERKRSRSPSRDRRRSRSNDRTERNNIPHPDKERQKERKKSHKNKGKHKERSRERRH